MTLHDGDLLAMALPTFRIAARRLSSVVAPWVREVEKPHTHARLSSTAVARHAISGPSALLEDAVTSRGWHVDEAQATAAAHLQKVFEAQICGAMHGGGIYIHGPVGSGKTALMDMLVAAATMAGKGCHRFHFHELMQHAHRAMHAGDEVPAIGRALGHDASLICLDEMQILDIADAAIISRLLEGILSTGAAIVTTSNRPPEELYAAGLNRHVYIPQLCETLKARGVLTHSLRSANGDYREVRVANAERRAASTSSIASISSSSAVSSSSCLPPPPPPPRFHLTEADASAASRQLSCLRHSLEQRANGNGGGSGGGGSGGGRLTRYSIALGGGRSLSVVGNSQAALMDFWELCGSPLGAGDYLELSRQFDCLALVGVPALSPELHNEARRLMTLIDVWYDRGKELHLSAAVPIELIFADVTEVQIERHLHGSGAAGSGAAGSGANAAPAAAAPAQISGQSVFMRGAGGASAGLTSTWLADGTEWSATGRLGVSLAALSGMQDVAFAQRRTVSRLRELLFAH